MQIGDIGDYIRRARQALNERRFDDARGIYQQILQMDPAQPRAWLALSAISQSQGDFRESVCAVRSAVPAWKRSGSQQFITELSMRLLVLGEYKEARDLIASADWSDPVVLRYSMGLVQYLGLTEAHEDALRLADYAMARSKNPPASLVFARANALRYLGRLQEATEAYERCIGTNPLHAEAHWTLAHHQASPVTGQRVARIRKALAHTNSDSEEAIYLNYALFKELDDAGEYQEAWEALQRGARLKRARLNYSSSEYAESYAAMQAMCDSSFLLDKRSGQTGADTQAPVFIVGLPRSGTTLLERMLGNHPDIISAGELNDFPNQLCWETNQFLAEVPSSDALYACRTLDFAKLGSGYLERTSWRRGLASRVIDKLPNNFLYAGFICKALPEARIVCVKRNPMDACFSLFKHLFSSSAYSYSYDLQETATHYRNFAKLLSHWEEILPDQMIQVDYEDLIAAPEQSLQKVIGHCGLPWVGNLERIQDNLAPSATASSSQVREEVHAKGIGAWRRYEVEMAPVTAIFSSAS